MRFAGESGSIIDDLFATVQLPPGVGRGSIDRKNWQRDCGPLHEQLTDPSGARKIGTDMFGTLNRGARGDSKNMAQMIDFEVLLDPVAKALAETVVNLKNRYRPKSVQPKPAKEFPSRPGKVIGTIRRGSYFVDANVVVYAALADDPRHEV